MLELALALVFLGLAYDFIGWRDGSTLDATALSSKLEMWFFDSAGSSTGLVALVVAWIAWTRLPRLSTAMEAGRTRGSAETVLAFTLAGVAISIHAWAALNAAADLFFASTALLIGSVSVFAAGTTGLRIMLLPIFVLLLAIPIPHPLINEVLWWLQNASATGTAFLLSLVGVDIAQAGPHLAQSDISFLVVEGCSGFRSIMTLTIVAIVIRELLVVPSWRGIGLVLIAPILALALNTVRILMIVLMSSPTNQDLASDHLMQGIVVLAAGTIILFVIGHVLAGRTSEPERQPIGHEAGKRLIRLTLAMIAVFALVNVAMPRWALPQHGRLDRIAVANASPDWKAAQRTIDFEFIGMLPRDTMDEWEFVSSNAGLNPVRMTIAASSSEQPRTSPISSKLATPGRDWLVEKSETVTLYALGHAVDVTRARSGNASALVYSWSMNDEGMVRDSLRSFLAIERGPFVRPNPRYMIQLYTPIGEGPESIAQAKRALNQFIFDFRGLLRSLE